MTPYWRFELKAGGWFYAIHDAFPRQIISVPPDDYMPGFKQNRLIGSYIKIAMGVKEP